MFFRMALPLAGLAPSQIESILFRTLHYILLGLGALCEPCGNLCWRTNWHYPASFAKPRNVGNPSIHRLHSAASSPHPSLPREVEDPKPQGLQIDIDLNICSPWHFEFATLLDQYFTIW